MKLFNMFSSNASDLNCKLGDEIIVTIGIFNENGLKHRNISFEVYWDSIVSPVMVDNKVKHDNCNLYENNDLIVKKITNKIAVSCTTKDNISQVKAGNVVKLYFSAINQGNGKIWVDETQAIDVINDLPVSLETEPAEANITVEPVSPTTGKIVFYINVSK